MTTPNAGRVLRESLREALGEHAHVKVVFDPRTVQQRIIAYCRACRSASMVSFHRHEITALWDDHVGSERHKTKAAVAEARAANHDGLFPESTPTPATAGVSAQPHGAAK